MELPQFASTSCYHKPELRKAIKEDNIWQVYITLLTGYAVTGDIKNAQMLIPALEQTYPEETTLFTNLEAYSETLALFKELKTEETLLDLISAMRRCDS